MARLVSSRRVPYLPITIEIPELRLTLSLEALLDTGFTGEVSLPTSSMPNGVGVLGYVTLRMADDSPVTAPAYLVTIRIGDTGLSPISIVVLGTEPVLGLGVITQFRTVIDHDRSVTVET